MWEFIKAILILGGFIWGTILLFTSEFFRMIIVFAFIFIIIAYVILSIMKEIGQRL